MKKIHIILDPNGTHIESFMDVKNNIDVICTLFNIIDNFVHMGLEIENDDDCTNIAFLVNGPKGNAVMYIYVD